MQIDIRTNTLTPQRNTFDHIVRRFGDKPASRYQEASYDVQATTNFHYRPLWSTTHQLNDKKHTAIVMRDWYDFKDPRQFYYGTYVLTRASMQDTAEKNFEFVEKRQLLNTLPPTLEQKIRELILPLRHLEWGANMNNCFISSYCFGTVTMQASIFQAMDRFGMAQYISRIGLLLDGNTGESLENAKTIWLKTPIWQEVRHYIEDSFVLTDWFELLLVQNFVLDGLIHPLLYKHFETDIAQNGGGAVLAMLTEFMTEWYEENTAWVDMMLKTAAGESAENKALLEKWLANWLARGLTAVKPLAIHALGNKADAALEECQQTLLARANKAGLNVQTTQHNPTAHTTTAETPFIQTINHNASKVYIVLQLNDESRSIVQAIEIDNPHAVVQYFPAMVRIEAANRLAVRRQTVSEKMGKEWNLQAIHLHLITIGGNLDEGDDAFILEWRM
ncbi:MmoB/DmpM family protein [Beggiatoa leptomitoformis]|uniref:Phenol hydroxylase n=1 Tax=Beggiatoa leptomitoformis TaxID=288004 RepID=A0A2N9YCA5_9GAMM|nr:MmoB/DmpM family protein [Beggiatoa leptomitoformis]AUI68066.1 phenol hydroxylase [Beggiatoa leptomitoformis]QGX03460.1 phenol hydroxylase [Beggiatoa leptomitoformis]